MKQKLKDIIFDTLAISILFAGFAYFIEKGKQYKVAVKSDEAIIHKLAHQQYYTFSEYYRSVTATVYHPVASQCDNTPNVTASGDTIDTELASGYRFVAVSRDLLKKHYLKYGDYIVVVGLDSYYDGVWQVKDTMASKYTNHIDFLQHRSRKGFLKHCFITRLPIMEIPK